MNETKVLAYPYIQKKHLSKILLVHVVFNNYHTVFGSLFFALIKTIPCACAVDGGPYTSDFSEANRRPRRTTSVSDNARLTRAANLRC